MGTTGMVAQAIGRKDNQSAILIGLQHGILALILGLAILIFQQPLQILGFAILSATPEVKTSGVDFYNALIWGAPATLINFVLIGWFLGQTQSSKVQNKSIFRGNVYFQLSILPLSDAYSSRRLRTFTPRLKKDRLSFKCCQTLPGALLSLSVGEN